MKFQTKYIPSLKKEVQFSIGQNAEDNFTIIDNSEPNDIWFHLADYSSSHVVAQIPDIKLDKKQKRQIITQGAVICKENSKSKSKKGVSIIYSEIQNVTKSTPIGTVSVSEQKITII